MVDDPVADEVPGRDVPLRGITGNFAELTTVSVTGLSASAPRRYSEFMWWDWS